jgi:hypothetical protein
MIVGFSIFVGCEKQDEIIPEDSIADTEDFAPEGKMMILGKQLENPYSVENMKKALKNVSLKSGTVGDIDISRDYPLNCVNEDLLLHFINHFPGQR